jgi:hypothetical protein
MQVGRHLQLEAVVDLPDRVRNVEHHEGDVGSISMIAQFAVSDTAASRSDSAQHQQHRRRNEHAGDDREQCALATS